MRVEAGGATATAAGAKVKIGKTGRRAQACERRSPMTGMGSPCVDDHPNGGTAPLFDEEEAGENLR
eukprot:5494307-Lingulodinium_polyedra.AAC.1